MKRAKQEGFPLYEPMLGVLTGVAIVVAVLVLTQRSPKTAPPDHALPTASKVGFDPAFFDYGPVRQAETVNHTFELVNRATNTLRVVVLETSCSCTLVSTNLLGKFLQPGEKTLLPVEFHSGSRSGPVDSTVTVALQGQGVRYVAQADLQVTVVPDYVLLPRTVIFHDVLPGQSRTATARLEPVAMADAALVRTQIAHGPFEISVLPRTVSVTFHAPAEARRRNYARTVVLRTTSPRVERIRFPVSASVTPEVVLTPDTLVLDGPHPLPQARVTVSTRGRSRIVAVQGLTVEGTRELSWRDESSTPERKWHPDHSLVFPTAQLDGVTNVQITLKADFGTGRIESRSALIGVQRLMQAND